VVFHLSNKISFSITRETLTMIGVDPEDAISYLENKKAIDMNPNHVMALHKLKNKTLTAFSKN